MRAKLGPADGWSSAFVTFGVAVGLLTLPAAARAQSDAFSGTILDRGKWDVSSPIGGSTVYQNDALFVTNRATGGTFCTTPGLLTPGAGVALRRKLAGDFDVAVDFKSFTGLAADASGIAIAALGVHQDAGHQLVIKRVRGQQHDGVQTAAVVGGALSEGPFTARAATAGKLRLVRSGNVITSYVDGTADFSFAGIAGPVTVTLMVAGSADPAAGVIFDAFATTSGQVLPQVSTCADGFDGSALDGDKWDVSSPLGGSMVLQGGLIAASNDGTSGRFCGAPGLFGPGAGLGLRRLLVGDFDVAVDYFDFAGVPINSPNPTPPFLTDYMDRGTQRHYMRRRGAAQDATQSVGRINNGTVNGPVANHPGTSGNLRIHRSGSTITTYVDGVPNFSVTAFSGPVLVSFMILGPIGTTSSALFDNFALEGTLTEPVAGCGNRAPVAFPGGPYLVDEGAVAALVGAAADPEGDPFRFDWDLDHDGSFELAGASASFAAGNRDGLAEYPIRLRVCDPDDACATAETVVKLANAAPTASFVAPSPLAAGEHTLLRLDNPADFSAADVAAGFRYSFACDGSLASLAASYQLASPTPSRDCSFATPGDYLVRGRIFDKDQGQRTYEALIKVTAPPNQPPSAEAGGPYDVGEGGSVTLHASGSDPDGNPLTFRWDLDGDGVFETTGAHPIFFATFADGPATRVVQLKICDDKAACAADSATVRIANVAPAATLVAPGLLNEGASADVALVQASDPGSADVAAGLRYGFSCTGQDAALPGSYASASAVASVRCAFPQNGSFKVKGRILDKDGGQRTYEAQIVVANQAPVALFTAQSPVLEASSSALALIGAADASPVDTAAGLRYGFACDGLDTSLPPSYAAASASTTASCRFDDNGRYPVKARVIDQDGGQTTYQAFVVVDNQVPTAVLSASAAIDEGAEAELVLGGAFDPSPIDRAAGLRYGFACDGLDASLPQSYATASPSYSATCPFSRSGSHTVKARVIDKDGGMTSYEATVVVTNLAPVASFTAESPIAEAGRSRLALGGASDASAEDLAAGLRYGFACDGLDASLPPSYAAASATSTASCRFDDNGRYPVKARVIDQDGGMTTYDAIVVVDNLAPTALLTATGPVVEGGRSLVALIDAGDASPVDQAAGFRYGFACDGVEAALPQSYASAGAASEAVCQFPESGRFTVKARIFDKDEGQRSYEVTIVVGNLAPLALLTATSPIVEGSASLVALVGASDSAGDLAAGLRYGFACDGQDATLPGGYETASALNHIACPFLQNGVYLVKARVFDQDGGATSYAATIVVENQAPTATFTSAGAIVEGGAATLALSDPRDPSPIDVAAGFRYGFACDGQDAGLPGSYAAAGPDSTQSCVFGDSGSYTVKARIFDQDGGQTTYQLTVVVDNEPPTARFTATSPIPEGGSSVLALTGAGDAGAGDVAAGFHYAFACDGQTASLPVTYATAGSDATVPCSFPHSGSYTVTGRIFDRDGGFTDYTAVVVVENVAPAVTLTVPQGPRTMASPVAVSAGFTDVGAGDTHTVLFLWGDGTSSVGPVNESGGAGVSATTHRYTAPGIYTVTVVVTDKDGATTQTTQPVVVFDPQSRVSGGGSYDLPSDCASPSSSHAGCKSSCRRRTARYSFTSKYQQGASTPRGQVEVELDLPEGDIHLRGTSQEWLLVSGATLKIKGTGTINGKGKYQFLITATDGKRLGRKGVDGFRIKIWNPTTGVVLHDNLPGLADASTETQPITTGDVTIHK